MPCIHREVPALETSVVQPPASTLLVPMIYFLDTELSAFSINLSNCVQLFEKTFLIV